MAGAETLHSWDLHWPPQRDWHQHHGPRQPGAGEPPLAAQCIHLQSQNIQGLSSSHKVWNVRFYNHLTVSVQSPSLYKQGKSVANDEMLSLLCYCITATVRFVKQYFAQLWGLTLHCLKKQSFHLCFGLNFRPDLAEAGGTHWCWLLLWHKCVWLSNIVLPFNNVSESLFRSDLWGEISQTNRQLSADNKLLENIQNFSFFHQKLEINILCFSTRSQYHWLWPACSLILNYPISTHPRLTSNQWSTGESRKNDKQIHNFCTEMQFLIWCLPGFKIQLLIGHCNARLTIFGQKKILLLTLAGCRYLISGIVKLTIIEFSDFLSTNHFWQNIID